MARSMAKQSRLASAGIGYAEPPPDMFDGRLTVGIDETATALGVGRDTVYIMLQDGRLIASKFGHRTVVHTSSIRQLLATTRLVLRPRARARARAAKAHVQPVATP